MRIWVQNMNFQLLIDQYNRLHGFNKIFVKLSVFIPISQSLKQRKVDGEKCTLA